MPEEIKLIPCHDCEEIPLKSTQVTWLEMHPQLKGWIGICPAGELLEAHKNTGLKSETFRIGKEYPEEKDEYGRIPFNRIRVRIEISAIGFIDRRTAAEIGECKCVRPDYGPERFQDNTNYCKTCKKLIHNYPQVPK